MRSIKYRDLAQMTRTMGAQKMGDHISEALESKELRPEDVDFCELGEALLGHEFRNACRPGAQNAEATKVLEAADAVDSTAFLDITQRVISAKLIEAFMLEANAAASLIDLETNVRVRHERRPGISAVGDEGEIVKEGMPYPAQDLGANYQDFADNEKRGLIVGLTKEALFFTGQSGEILRQAARVGEWLGVNKDKRIWNVILGIANNYNYNGTAYNTYNAAAIGTPAIVPRNIHGNALNSYADINEAERLFDLMVDPDTGEAIEINGMTILVMPYRAMTARSILTATEKQTTTGADVTVSGNPLGNGYTLGPVSRRARAILAATGDFGDPDGIWLMGDFKKAFVYRENWPVTVSQEPVNATVEFEQDIVVRYKASERGGAWVKRPHYVVISSGSCGHSSSGDAMCDVDAWPAIDANAPN